MRKTAAQLSPSARNVLKVWRSATPDQHARGMVWYADAADYAAKLAADVGVDVATAAGVLAAVSPLNSWGHNKVLARRILETRNTSSGYLKVGLRKARAILDGADPLDVLTSAKVRNFYLAISTHGREGVCIDRHAWSIAVGTRRIGTNDSVKGARYANSAAAYVRAAEIASRESGRCISPAQVQAVTWVAWRERYWAVGAWDGA